MNIKDVKNLCKKYGVYPSKKMGQNFLINEAVLKKIIKTADLSKNDIVLEIGPGIGNLTLELAKKAGKVIAIEKDKRMCEILRKVLEGLNIRNVRVINNDILKLDPKRYTLKPYRVIANLPYYITSPVIRKFLEAKKTPKEMILMVQKEVAQRICNRPPDMSILSVSVQFYAQPKIISFVSKKSFWPQPKVDSAILQISPIHANLARIDTSLFFKIVKAGFSHPRKQLINNLSRLNFSSKNLSGQARDKKVNREKVKNWLLKNKVKPTQRAETLTLNNWQKLTKTFKIQ